MVSSMVGSFGIGMEKEVCASAASFSLNVARGARLDLIQTNTHPSFNLCSTNSRPCVRTDPSTAAHTVEPLPRWEYILYREGSAERNLETVE